MLLALSIWLVPSRHSNSPHAILPQQAHVVNGWRQLVKKGVRELASKGGTGWPFAASSAAQVPMVLQKSAEDVLLDPQPLELRFGDARYLRKSGQAGLWLVPGHAVLCMFREPDMAASCSTASQAHRQGLVLQTYKVGVHRGQPKQFKILGVAPDGIGTVSVTVGTRQTEIPVANNVYSTEARTPISVLPLSK